ncbi:hypothetical protein PNEG_03161 [Pneumocystis murina B123]|uniref:Eukaryotic translation initiation factor 2A n=1 Tax=Pneumocystis murina (strain B123) TaxID=1069680 RepID=M7NMH6_PNEMU|nr:hypothetical protein PNEG_03161 [Pneumocystis murina B123]EMR08321.1 hypothetical protein PNEG_03161 [Pneumocystis murina B123]
MVFTQFACRTAQYISLTIGHPLYTPLPGFDRPEKNTVSCCYGQDGRFFAWSSLQDVKIIDTSTGELVRILEIPKVCEIKLSPKSNFIVTWERPSKAEDGSANKNLKIWKINTGQKLCSFVQKSQIWNLQYTTDGKLCARKVTNEIQFFESANMEKGPIYRLHANGVSSFSLSPGRNNVIAVFIPEMKGTPATVSIYNIPTFSFVISQKAFYKADNVQMKWNKIGTTLIISTSTDVDKTNKNYYGETNMYILSAIRNYDSRINLDKEGPIHDITWSPNSREFGVVYGYMPSKTTIFDNQANIIYSLPLSPRNTILFSPHDRFVLVAGFGNLKGTIDIYDKEKEMKKITTIEASNSTVCEWSPDGRHILTGITSPRLRVDNGIKIWHYSGALMYSEEINELYEVFWQPQNPEIYPLRSSLSPVPKPHSSASLVANKTPLKSVGAYRPPHARSTATPKEYKREDEKIMIISSQEIKHKTTTDPFIPGANPSIQTQGSSKAALKNKKRRDAAKKAKESKVIDVQSTNGISSQSITSNLEPPHVIENSLDNENKKIRSLLKKLRAIEKLKTQQEKGNKLEDTQIEKIATEGRLRSELKALGWNDQCMSVK